MVIQPQQPTPPQGIFYLLDTRNIWPPPSTPNTKTIQSTSQTAPAYSHDDRTRNAISTSPSAQPHLNALPADEQAKINRFHFHRDGRLALGSAVLKRYFVCRALRSTDINGSVDCDTAVAGAAGDGGGEKVKWQDIRFGRRVTALDRREGVREDSERGKPCYLPPVRAREIAGAEAEAEAGERSDEVELDFNTSHQAGLVVLGGYRFPRSTMQTATGPLDGDNEEAGQGPQLSYSIGVDVTCTSERMERDLEMIRKESEPEPGSGLQAHRGVSKLPSGVPIRGVQPGGMRVKNEEKRLEVGFSKFVDMHEEVFSHADMEAMKGPLSDGKDVGNAKEELGGLRIPHSEDETDGGAGEEDAGLKVVKALLRRFYAYWALKEAYVKMEGEALLADWLKDVEFRHVRVPRAAAGDEKGGWGEAVEKIAVYLRGKRRDNVQMFLQAYEDDYLVATAVVRGPGLPEVEVPTWEHVDIEKNIVPLMKV